MPQSPIQQPANGQWKDGEFFFPMRVYYEDTDIGGMTYHARYVSFFERVRSESIRGTNLDVHALMGRDKDMGGPIVYVVRNLNITYHRQSTVDDIIIGYSRVTKVRAAAIEVAQRIENAAGELITEATLLVAAIDPDTGRPKRWPDDLKATWQRWHDDYQAAQL